MKGKRSKLVRISPSGTELHQPMIFSLFFFDIPGELNTHDEISDLSLLENIKPKRDGGHFEVLVKGWRQIKEKMRY
ncbi:MAG: hypothetical protein D3903_20800 [Candidatus Electrothrix sp. GM3_4]|nr:hypothetical protein [Candidatus Electrothrix sp. GM3_4]